MIPRYITDLLQTGRYFLGEAPRDKVGLFRRENFEGCRRAWEKTITLARTSGSRVVCLGGDNVAFTSIWTTISLRQLAYLEILSEVYPSGLGTLRNRKEAVRLEVFSSIWKDEVISLMSCGLFRRATLTCLSNIGDPQTLPLATRMFAQDRSSKLTRYGHCSSLSCPLFLHEPVDV